MKKSIGRKSIGGHAIDGPRNPLNLHLLSVIVYHFLDENQIKKLN